MPRLLNLRLEGIASPANLKGLDLPTLRKLTINLYGDRGSYNFNPLDYPVLHELGLGMYEKLKRVDVLSFSCLATIRLRTRYFTNPEGNHLCTALLCHPEGCPMLQELHFQKSLEWDILILMLERRNYGLRGVKRIHSIALPFVPFIIRQTLKHLLTGESAERPSLVSISLEATREMLFNSDV